MGQMANPWSTAPTAPDGSPSWEGVTFLECEREYWGNVPGKEDVVFQTFGIGLASYYHQLHRHCRSKEALMYDAHLARAILDAADSAVSRRLVDRGGVG